MTRFSAMKAESFFLASIMFFGGKFGNFDCVNVHCVGVTRFRGRWGERLVRVRRFDVPSGDFVSVVPLGLEVNGFLVPVTNSGRDGVHRHNVAHEGGGNSGGVVADENVFIVDGRHSYVILKEGGVFYERWRVLVSSSIFSGFLYHSLGGEPGDGVGLYIMVFECGFEIGNENCESSHGNGGAYEGVVPEGYCPG